METSASKKKLPKRPRTSMSSIVLRPMISNGRTTTGTAGSAIEGAPERPERPQGEIFRVEVVLQHEHARKPGTVPERVVPPTVGALGVEEVADAALDGVGAGTAGREERQQRPRRLARRRRPPAGEAGLVVTLARLAPPSVRVLVQLQPPHGALDVLVLEALPDGREPPEHGPGPVDVVHAPAPEPRAVVALRAADERQRAARRLEVAPVPHRPHQLESTTGEIFRRRVEERAVVGEGDVVEVQLVVVRVERGPATVSALHAEEPAEPALLGRSHPFEAAHLLERHQHHRAVVEVGIEVVGVLERPAARLYPPSPCLPVARYEDLAFEQPLGGPAQRWIVGRAPAFEERSHRQRRVPYGRRTWLVGQLFLVLDRERLHFLELADHEGMVVRVPEQSHGENRIRHRRIDAAEAARHHEALLQPEAGRLERAPAERAGRGTPPNLEGIGAGDEEALPQEAAPRERLRHPGKAQAGALARFRPELVQ